MLPVLGEIFQRVYQNPVICQSGAYGQEKVFVIQTFTNSKPKCALRSPLSPGPLSQFKPLSVVILVIATFGVPVFHSPSLREILLNCKSEHTCHPSVPNLSMAPHCFRIKGKFRTLHGCVPPACPAHSSPHTILIPARLRTFRHGTSCPRLSWKLCPHLYCFCTPAGALFVLILPPSDQLCCLVNLSAPLNHRYSERN